MKDLIETFGWSAIRRNIDDPKDLGNNLINIFRSMTSLKLEHANKQTYHYWGPGDGNDRPYVLGIWDIDPAARVDDRTLLFARFCLDMMSKWIKAHILKPVSKTCSWRSNILSGLEPIEIRSGMDWLCFGWY